MNIISWTKCERYRKYLWRQYGCKNKVMQAHLLRVYEEILRSEECSLSCINRRSQNLKYIGYVDMKGRKKIRFNRVHIITNPKQRTSTRVLCCFPNVDETSNLLWMDNITIPSDDCAEVDGKSLKIERIAKVYGKGYIDSKGNLHPGLTKGEIFSQVKRFTQKNLCAYSVVTDDDFEADSDKSPLDYFCFKVIFYSEVVKQATKTRDNYKDNPLTIPDLNVCSVNTPLIKSFEPERVRTR